MRNIEYRAFDTQVNEYFYCLQSIHFDKEIGITCLSTFDSLTLWENFILEQFTDKYDINNKKIFEGDKVTCIMPTNSQQCEAVVEWSQQYLSFILRAITGEGFIDNLSDCRYIKVIGNVHDREYRQ